ncbi:zinc knuckle CX2CX4HX4C containing protein [Tanacetum coccineum]
MPCSCDLMGMWDHRENVIIALVMKWLGFLDNEKQETDNPGIVEALAALEATLKIQKEPKEEKQSNHLPHKEQDSGSFILPCSIGKLDFNNALAGLRASISVMSLSMYKRLGIGKLKQINMVTEMADNTKCTPKGIVENLLIKIDKFIFPVDFVILDMAEDLRMPIILGRPWLATAHAKVDIFRKSISLELESEKVIFKIRSSFTTTNFASVCSNKREACLEDDDFKKLIMIYSYTILNPESYEEIVYRITEMEKEKYSAPQEKRSINESKQEELEWENLSLNDWMKIRYGRVCKMTRERILKDHWRKRYGDEEDDLEENLEDLEECGKDKANAIMWAIHDKLNDDWFNNTSKDEDDFEGILYYLEPRSYDGFIYLNDEAYNKRKCKLLGMTYEEPTLILIEKVKVTRYTIGPGEIYTKVKVLGVDEIPRTRDNVAAMRARLIEKMAHEGNGQAKT